MSKFAEVPSEGFLPLSDGSIKWALSLITVGVLCIVPPP